LTPFPQQQFNATEDRRSELPSIGSACFDCHSNGYQNGATHLAPDTRPRQFRHRIKTISLRGLNIHRLFGSQRALKTVEDFTEFEQRTAYIDGDIVIAAEKGLNHLERGSRVDFMGDFQEMLDFQPAPKLDILGKLDPASFVPRIRLKNSTVSSNKTLVMQIGRVVLGAPQRKGFDRPLPYRHHVADHHRVEEALGLEVVHQIVGVERRLMAAGARTSCKGLRYLERAQ
jgi:hypothetical protein